MTANPNLAAHTKEYAQKLNAAIHALDAAAVQTLADAMGVCWRGGHTIYLCGNGGSAGNAIHLANDFVYGAGRNAGVGFKCIALPANNAVITCLANDLGYEHIFSEQLRVLAKPEDILVVLSGSGNSPNIVKVLDQAKSIGMKSFAIVGYNGGKAKAMATTAIHVAIDDMQIAEDMQMVIGHILMQWFCAHSSELLTQAA